MTLRFANLNLRFSHFIAVLFVSGVSVFLRCGAAGAEPSDKAVPLGTVQLGTMLSFGQLLTSLQSAVEANGMRLVSRASASEGAAARGIKIPGNAVLMVFRNDYAVRLLEADVAAGIEAPVRFYIAEEPDGSATLSYRKPSALFAPYRNREVNDLANELDTVIERIASDAIRSPGR